GDCASASAVDADEVEHGVLVDDGGLLQFGDVAVVLQVGTGERQAADTVRLDEHALELDLRESPPGALLAHEMPDVADVRLAVAGPALGADGGVPAYFVGEAGEI